MIKKFFIIGFLLFVCSKIFANDTAEIILIKENSKGVEFEKVTLDNNSTMVFSGQEILTTLLPISPGRAGEYIELKNKEDRLVLTYSNGIIKFKAVSPDAQEFSLPDIKYADLKTYEIRASIIGGNGFQKSYLIKNYDTIEEDSGPVVNMFAGKIEPKDGEYLLSYDIKISVPAVTLTGKVPFIRSSYGWILVEGGIEGGEKGYFIIDFGATSTVMVKDYLPKGTRLSMPIATQYSKDGEKKVEVVMQGANDTVSSANYLGKTDPVTLVFGDVAMDNVSIRVLNDFPPTLRQDNNIIGILGMDVLRRAGSISFHDSFAHLGEELIKEASVSIPFTSITGFVILDGTINGSAISYVVDTGARYTIIPEQTLDKLSVPYSLTGDEIELRGMDNVPVKSAIVKLNDKGLELGSVTLPQNTVVMSDPAALKALGLEKDVMILGMDIMGKYKYMGVDFKNKIFALN